MTNNNIVHGYGAINSSYDIRDYKIHPISTLPDEYSTTKIPVKNQKSESSCVAHALSVVIEYHYLRCSGLRRVFSTEFIYGLREPGYYIGDGMVIRDALKTITKYGDTYTTDCKGNNDYKTAMDHVYNNIDTLLDLAAPHKISAYVKLKTIEEMKTAIITDGPIIASMNWYNGYKLVDNVYTCDTNNKFGRHCVVIYGWNKDGWLVQNSWGASFGDRGRFVVPYSFKFNEVWGIIDNIDDTTLEVIKPSSNKLIKIYYKVFNRIVNWYIKTFKKEK